MNTILSYIWQDIERTIFLEHLFIFSVKVPSYNLEIDDILNIKLYT